LVFSGASAWNKTDVDSLKEALLTGYNVHTRPSANKEKTSCHITMTIINIDLDERRSVLSSHVWLKMNWSDSKLVWDPESNDNITELRISADEVR
jgi:Neurotransmitter-gated ion-channel ligand binding domain